jgi:hypothetical protein
MSEELNNEESAPATLVEGEAVVQLTEQIENAVEEQKTKNKETKKTEKVEEVAAVKIEEAPAVEADVITLPKETPKPGLGVVGNGAMGSTTFSKEEVEQEKIVVKTVETNGETIAIHSSRNVTWQGVGSVIRGYNILPKAQAEQWLIRNHVRLATPEEVAKGYLG